MCVSMPFGGQTPARPKPPHHPPTSSSSMRSQLPGPCRIITCTVLQSVPPNYRPIPTIRHPEILAPSLGADIISPISAWVRGTERQVPRGILRLLHWSHPLPQFPLGSFSASVISAAARTDLPRHRDGEFRNPVIRGFRSVGGACRAGSFDKRGNAVGGRI